MSAPGWHPDPTGKYEYRWWNGTHWTTDVASHGVTTVDLSPFESKPHPTPQPAAAQPTVPLPVTPRATETPPVSTPTPTVPPPPAVAVPSAPSPPSSPRNRRTTAIAGGVAAVALCVGAFLVLGGDDDSSTSATSTSAAASTSLAPASTLPPTSSASTTVATSTSTTSVTTTTTIALPVDVTGALLQAMPDAGEVPADWMLYEESDPDPALNLATGYCGGPGWAAAASDQGAVGMIHGPNWDLSTGGWFGLSAFTFDSAAEASAYLAAIDLQANGCMTDPVVFEAPEAEYGIFTDGFGDDAVWNVAEVNGSFPGPTTDADEMTLVIFEEFISTTYQGSEFSLVRTELQRFERHGRTVVAFWLWGEHDLVGFGNADELTSYLPTEVDLDAAAAVIRSLIVERLRTDGLA